MSRKSRNADRTKAVETAIIPEISPLSRNGLSPNISPDPADMPVKQRPPANPEPFVTAKEAASFLCLTVRRVHEMARLGQLPAHPLGAGKRHTWRFRLSELAHALVADHSLARSGTIFSGSPSGPGQEK